MTRVGAWLYRICGYRRWQHKHRWVAERVEIGHRFKCECGAICQIWKRGNRAVVNLSRGHFDASDVAPLLALTKGDLQLGETDGR